MVPRRDQGERRERLLQEVLAQLASRRKAQAAAPGTRFKPREPRERPQPQKLSPR